MICSHDRFGSISFARTASWLSTIRYLFPAPVVVVHGLGKLGTAAGDGPQRAIVAVEQVTMLLQVVEQLRADAEVALRPLRPLVVHPCPEVAQRFDGLIGLAEQLRAQRGAESLGEFRHGRLEVQDGAVDSRIRVRQPPRHELGQVQLGIGNLRLLVLHVPDERGAALLRFSRVRLELKRNRVRFDWYNRGSCRQR